MEEDKGMPRESNKKKVSYENRHRGKHSCETIVIACSDFRFNKEIVKHLPEVGVSAFDLICFPGASKMVVDRDTLPAARKAIKVLRGAHGTEKVVIVDHYNCGAYAEETKDLGGDLAKEKKFHLQKMNEARKQLSADFPGLRVVLAYMDWSKLEIIED
jgi:carbonic anhydrase